jgi:RNA polymerase primary sigma factor
MNRIERAKFFNDKIAPFLSDTITDKKHIKIMELRYGMKTGKPMTLNEVGKIYGVTRERIRQIEKNIFNKIKKIYEKTSTGETETISCSN